jgi:hypothetical protein
MNPREKFVLAFAVFIYAFAIFSPYYILAEHSVPLDKEANATSINGILAVSVIIFGLSSLNTREIDKIEDYGKYMVFFVLFVVQVALLAFSGFFYFGDNATRGYPTFGTMMLATVSLLFNLGTWMVVRLLRTAWKIE